MVIFAKDYWLSVPLLDSLAVDITETAVIGSAVLDLLGDLTSEMTYYADRPDWRTFSIETRYDPDRDALRFTLEAMTR